MKLWELILVVIVPSLLGGILSIGIILGIVYIVQSFLT